MTWWVTGFGDGSGPSPLSVTQLGGGGVLAVTHNEKEMLVTYNKHRKKGNADNSVRII